MKPNQTITLDVKDRSLLIAVKNSHSQLLLNEIMQIPIDLCIHFPQEQMFQTRERQLLIEAIKDYFETLHNDQRITSSKVIFDKRNNPPAAHKKTAFIDMIYKQKNCLTTTMINVAIKFKQQEKKQLTTINFIRP